MRSCREVKGVISRRIFASAYANYNSKQYVKEGTEKANKPKYIDNINLEKEFKTMYFDIFSFSHKK